MYLYNLHGYEHNTVLTHDKEFTEEEFTSMCDETPKFNIEYEAGIEYYYDDIEVINNLIEKYGFQKATYQASLFVD